MGDHYLLNGTKKLDYQWWKRSLHIVIAQTDVRKKNTKESMLHRRKGWEGFPIGKKEEKLGIRVLIPFINVYRRKSS